MAKGQNAGILGLAVGSIPTTITITHAGWTGVHARTDAQGSAVGTPPNVSNPHP